MNPHPNIHFWKASLVGDSPHGLRLGRIIWDLGAFRPDPRDYLEKEAEYSSKVRMEQVHLFSGRKVKIPREVWIQNHHFYNVR